MHIVNVGLPQSEVGLVPGTGVKVSIGNAFISLHGNWRVKYLKIMWVKKRSHRSSLAFWGIFAAAVTSLPLSAERTVALLI